MLPAKDSEWPHRLHAMTSRAISLLENPEGFVLMAEGSQIDWCGHANDIACAMAEMEDFAKTVEYVYEYASKRDDTLVVVTADHSTGGLTMGARGDYAWKPAIVDQINASTRTIAQAMIETDDINATWRRFADFDLRKSEQQSLAEVGEKLRDMEVAIKKIVDKRTVTGWTTNGHTAVDVGVFAYGPGSERFRGTQDNTEIGKKLLDLLQ